MCRVRAQKGKAINLEILVLQLLCLLLQPTTTLYNQWCNTGNVIARETLNYVALSDLENLYTCSSLQSLLLLIRITHTHIHARVI